jgi:hypothetical protein
MNLKADGNDRAAPRGQMYLHQARLSDTVEKMTDKKKIATPTWIQLIRSRNGIRACVNIDKGVNHSKKVHPENTGIIKPPNSMTYLTSRNHSGNQLFFLPKEVKSCINPMGQIHPQKALPKKAVAISMMTAGTRDKMGTWVLVRIAFRLKMGSNLHMSLMGDDGRVILYNIKIRTWD